MLLYFYLTDKAYNTFLCSEGCFGYFINVCENRIILLMMFQDTELLEKKTNIFSEKKKTHQMSHYIYHLSDYLMA